MNASGFADDQNEPCSRRALKIDMTKKCIRFFSRCCLIPILVPFLIASGPVRTQGQPAEAASGAERPSPAEEPSVDANAAAAEPRPRRRSTRTPRSPRSRARLPQGVFGENEPARPGAASTLLGGTVPAIWEIEPQRFTQADDELPDVLQYDSMAPAVPGKVVRYATLLMQRYDLNGDGRLQDAEWKKMPGAPQAVDLDGDLVITLEELVRFLGLYGRHRTIHHPNPAERYDGPKTVASDYQLFVPISAPPPAPAASSPASPSTDTASESLDPAPAAPPTDLSEEMLEAESRPVDDATYEEIITGRQIPAERKYYTSPEALRGVPAWFLIRDRDGDGQVSLSEFAPSLSARALALFGRLDLNGDGFITPNEVRPTAQTGGPGSAP